MNSPFPPSFVVWMNDWKLFRSIYSSKHDEKAGLGYWPEWNDMIIDYKKQKACIHAGVSITLGLIKTLLMITHTFKKEN